MKIIPNGVTMKVARQILIVKKNSPQVMFVGGIVGVTASTVMACRATLKLGEQLDKMRFEMNAVKEMRDDEDNAEVGDKDVAYIYARNVAKVARLYAPAAVVGGISIGALTGSHVTLTRRNTAMTAAYAGLAKAYDEYRERVREELGEEREVDIYHGAIDEKVKNGSKTEVHKIVDPNGLSPYSRFFDEGSTRWQRNAEMNRLFVQVQQTYANELLRARGHIFLNEVYEMLGFEHSQAGAVVGWVIGEDGDNFVDFGIHEAVNSKFVNGMERTALLDFNVDGVIWDLI